MKLTVKEIDDLIESMIIDNQQYQIYEAIFNRGGGTNMKGMLTHINNKIIDMGYSLRKSLHYPREKDARPQVKLEVLPYKDKMYESFVSNFPSKPEMIKYSYSKFSEYLSHFGHDVSRCSQCDSLNQVKTYHVDEDYNNYLPSNLIPLCEECYTSLYVREGIKPFVTIGRTFTFAASHHLPHHKGQCRFQHGHAWRVEIKIKGRVNPYTGMVMDFGDLQRAVNTYVLQYLDHSYLNNTLYNPTAENILIWLWSTLMFSAKLKGIHKITVWETPESIAELNIAGMLSVFTQIF